MSPLKVITLLALAFGAGYMIGNSSNDELKGMIDNVIEKFERGSEKVKSLVVELIDTSEEMDSDELKANLEKLVSYAMEKVDEFTGE